MALMQGPKYKPEQRVAHGTKQNQDNQDCFVSDHTYTFGGISFLKKENDDFDPSFCTTGGTPQQHRQRQHFLRLYICLR